MKSTIRLFTAITMSLATLGAHAATLSVGDNLMIESVNGKVVENQPATLAEGTHLVELRFSERYYTNAGSSGTWVQSAPLFTQVTVTHNEVLQLATPELKTEADARQYVKQPRVLVSSDTGRNELLQLNTQAQLMTQLLTRS